MEEVQVISSCYGQDVLPGVPRRVEDLAVEVEAVHADLVLFPLAPRADPPRLQDLQRFRVLAGGLQRDVAARVAVEYPEEVVVGAGHDCTVGRARRVKRYADRQKKLFHIHK